MQANYHNYKITDFAVDDFFLKHQLHPTESSELFWKEWLISHPNKNRDWEEAQKLVEAVVLGLTDYTRTYLSIEAEAELLARIRLTNQGSQETRIAFYVKWGKIAVAAVLMIALSLGGLWLMNKRNLSDSIYGNRIAALKNSVTEIINEQRTPLRHELPDGSIVILSPASKISYASDYEKEKRIVYLDGKANFEVKKNPLKPFYVYANEIVTKVLGTQFEVNAFENNQNVVVKVLTGQVSVYQINEYLEDQNLHLEKSGVLLTPNQQVVFVRESAQFNKNIVSMPSILESKDLEFVYDEERVPRVLEDIEKAYGVDIVYNREILENCGITADLARESMYEKLDVVCKSIGASYEIVDAQVIINSSGCKAE